MMNFQVDYLDHVAIRVKDLEVSANWYKTVLGLKKYTPKHWGDFPIFMLQGKSGVALFPAKENGAIPNRSKLNFTIDHFAFSLTNENFLRAKKHLDALDISFEFQDHHYFNSIYFQDPDGHTVELTTLVVPEPDFYNEEN